MQTRSWALLLACLAACGARPTSRPAIGAQGQGAGTTVPQTSAPAPDGPSTLVTAEEAASILGQSVTHSEPRASQDSMRYCCYFPAKSWPGLVQIGLLETDRIPEPFLAKGLDTAATFFCKARAKAGVHAQPRPGFGDEAFFDLSSLHVLAGDAYLIISAVVSKDGMNTTNDESALETLARKALARLR